MNLARTIAGWGINIAIALTALRTNLMRSILTTLGVMIGVLAVILAVAVGDGAKLSVMESINQLGSNMAIIFPQPENRGGRRVVDRGRLTERDAAAIQRLVPGVSGIAPQLRSTVQLVIQGRNTTTTAVGVTAEYPRVANVEIDTGRLIEEADVRTASRVIVVGASVATKLFGSFDPLGQSVRVNRVPFTIIGVLASKGSTFGNDNDDLTLVPITTARQRFASTATQGPDDLHVLFVGFDDGIELAEAKKNIVRVLRARNNVPKGEISPFTVNTTEEFMKQTGVVTSVFQGVLVAIASISLLVGGIGIMNIMLVSVTERTREIGLRMALGAKRSDIRNQFLVEAAVLCVIGGAIGLALAAGLSVVLEKALDFPVVVSLSTAIGAILFSAFIGLAFGSYPAIRASRLSPIEALRSE
ncbi:ABC transporter permease [Sphingomonas sp. SUN039]|uniref:ABC transporter permease n=1 Tax=Sphingomonas sp. SUN039 TaxID=2937787 RepID=UPI0021645F28|nr:ABC transporter permease [Sphingomonas sp. SUN039]UVO54805.1 ABC transporter permease [Sphingomonas sp. SUN039]